MKPTLELIHNFLKQLDEQSSWGAIPTAERLEMMAVGIKIFPASYYQGLAYRIISDEASAALLPKFSSYTAGELASSWSNSLEGCSNFLVDIVLNDKIDTFSGFLLEASIIGFSLQTWLELYEDLKITHPHYPEVPAWVKERKDEIILIEVTDIGANKKFTFDVHREPSLVVE
jgi:hypothetical protein